MNSPLQNPWFSPKRKRFWAVLLVLLYTLGGFFLVPYLVKTQVTGTLREQLGREASIEQVRFNPYVLSLDVTGFQLNDTDGEALTGFDELFVNLQLASLFNWAWTFREIRLDGYFLGLERFSPGDSRLGRLLEDAAKQSPNEPVQQEDGGLPRLLIHQFSLNEGSARFIDRVPENPVELAIGPVSVSVQELNTLPDRYGRQSVTIRLPDDATVRWQGTISLAPLESEGELTIENSHLDQTIAYLEAVLPLDSVTATLTAKTDYRINEMADGGLDIELDGLELQIGELAVSGLTPSTGFLTLPALELKGGTVRYPEQELNFSSVLLSDPGLELWLDENGRLNLLDLAPPATGPGDPGANDSGSAAWRIGAEEVAIEGGRLRFTDYSIPANPELGLTGLALTLKDISNKEGTSIPLRLAGDLEGGGRFEVEGTAVVLPDFSIEGATRVTSIPLSLAQPYVEQQFSLMIEDGVLSSQTNFTFGADQALTVDGSLEIASLKARDTAANEDLLGWEQLLVDKFELETTARSLHLSRVEFKQPYGRLKINPDRSTNVAGLVIEQQAAQPGLVDEAPAPWSVIIGGTSVNDGVLDFSDLSLPLPFSARISSLDGTISTIDNKSVEPANIRMEGQVNEFGLARIEGHMRIFDPIGYTDVSVEFRNLLMSNLSPYSAQFAGRKIDQGKLDLDLLYGIEQGQLKGENSVVLKELVLGDEVESPDAVSLPLGLAVALLTDANGVIDIDLPVEGDINSPEFRIGGVIAQAIVSLITKVVSAPFRMLGALIGVESEDFGQFQFLAGRSDLTPPELEKIGQLQEALLARPELGIEISGVYDPALDVPKLKFSWLKAAVIDRLGNSAAVGDEDIEMLDEEVRSILEAIFVERFPDETPESLKEAHTAPPAGDPEGKPVLDELAYSADLRDRLLASKNIGMEELEGLANARAQAVSAAFLAGGVLDESRIVNAEPTEVNSDDGEWVLMELGVTAR